MCVISAIKQANNASNHLSETGAPPSFASPDFSTNTGQWENWEKHVVTTKRYQSPHLSITALK